MSSLEQVRWGKVVAVAGGTVLLYAAFRGVKGALTIAIHEVLYRAGDSVAWIKPAKS
jgi:hypothetical protein